MYSSRRYYPRYKSRQYYHKKKINQKFSPAAYKNNPPTYYQQKGRIIQTSPLNLYQVPRQIPNSQTLQKMYNALVKARYPGVGPSSGGTIDPNLEINFSVNNIPITDIFSFADDSTPTSVKIGKEYCDYIISTVPNLPPPAAGYRWFAALMYILYDYDQGQVANTSQFHLDYVNDWLTSNPLTLMQKTLTTNSVTDSYNGIIFLAGYYGNNIKYARVTFTTGSMQNSMSNAVSSAVLPANTDLISIINSLEDNYLELTRDLTQQDKNVPGKISLLFRISQYRSP